MKVKLQDIYIGTRRRKNIGQQETEDLAVDMRENGQITAITLRPPSQLEREELGVTQPWVLVAGGRRLAAAYLNNWPEIEAFGRDDDIDELKHRLLELHENVKRLDMSFVEVAQAKAEMLAIRQAMAEKEGKTITQGEVAREMGDSPATFSRDIAVAEAIAENPELKKAPSRKAVIRHREMERELNKRLSAKDVMSEQLAEDLGYIQKQVRTEDARDYLLTVAPGSVDLLLTDPPYGIDYWKSGNKMRAGGPGSQLGMSEFNDKLDATKAMLEDLVPLWARALRDTGWAVVFMSQDLFGFVEGLFKGCCAVHHEYADHGKKVCNASDGTPCRFFVPEMKRWIWYRPNSRNRPRYPDRHAMNYYEDILVVNAGYGRMAPGSNVLIHDAEYGEERIHDNQKPLLLGKEIVSRLTLVGDTVLDTCFGSGAFLAAAASMGRRPLGCDTNPDMRAAALGYIAKYFVPSPRKSTAELHEQEKQRHGDTGVAVFEEVEVAE